MSLFTIVLLINIENFVKRERHLGGGNCLESSIAAVGKSVINKSY